MRGGVPLGADPCEGRLNVTDGSDDLHWPQSDGANSDHHSHALGGQERRVGCAHRSGKSFGTVTIECLKT